ncbi:MAG: hypothetical protein AAF252_07050 [Pseudomonadota bacterium]
MGSLILLVGVEIVVFGQVGIVQGLAKWIGGFLMFLILSVLSLPIGLLLRFGVGRLPIKPLLGALLAGLAVGVTLIFVLHPAMYRQVSFGSEPLSLILVHSMAGMAAGTIWYGIEFAGKDVIGD